MIYGEAALLTCLVSFGVLNTFTDFNKGIIPNKYIIWGFAVAVLFHVVLFFTGESAYYPGWLLNMAIADLLAFLMFYTQMWAAGDAKLFLLMYFCLPPRLFDQGNIALSVTPYVFIFIPALCWTLVDSVIRLIRKEPKKTQAFQWMKWLVHCLFVVIESTALFQLLVSIFPSFVVNNQLLIAALMMIYAYFCASVDYMRRWYILLIHIVMIAGFIIFNGEIHFTPSWRNYLLLLAVLGFQRLASLYNYQQIRTSDVKAGMIPAMETVLLFQTSRVQSLPTNGTEEMTAKLTEEEAAAVRRWENSAKGSKTIWIVRKEPFALYILLGFVIWVIVRLVGVH